MICSHFGTILGQIYIKNPFESTSEGFYRDACRIQTCDRKVRYSPVKTKEVLTYAEFSSGRSKNAKAAIEAALPCVAAASEICSKLGSAFDWNVFESQYRQWYENNLTVSSVDKTIII